MEFGKNLKQLREYHGLSQRQLAKKINLPYADNSVISKYESGERIPSIKRGMEIASFFNVPLSVLLGDGNIDDEIVRLLLGMRKLPGLKRQVIIEVIKEFLESVASKPVSFGDVYHKK